MSQLLCHEYSFRQHNLPLSPTHSQSQSACQAAFCTTQFKQSPLKRQRNQTKSGTGKPSSAACPARFPASCERAGLSGVAWKGGTCCENRQVHVFVIPSCSSCTAATAVVVNMILIDRRKGIKDRSALPSGLTWQARWNASEILSISLD